jgi:uncharacterized protein (TIGR03435 family)
MTGADRRIFRRTGLPGMLALGFVLLLPVQAGFGQAEAIRPSFEAATIKPNTSGGPTGQRSISGGTYVLRNWTMRMLVRFAYAIPVESEPEWFGSDHFDVVAKAPPKADVAPMLQTLLAERFGLVAHQVRKARPAYVLSVAKGGPKLRPPEPGGSSCVSDPSVPDRIHFSCRHGSIGDLILILARAQDYIDQWIVDETALTGTYAFEIEWTPARQYDSGAGGLTVFSAVRAQLGLQLEKRQAPLPVLVSDRVHRMPKDD